MASRSVVMLTTGESGSGKSYIRCAKFLCDEFLPQETGHHWSNFPLGVVPNSHAFPPSYAGETFIERVAEHVAHKTKRSKHDVATRLHTIPEEELKRWIQGTSGPWVFFDDIDLEGCHIAIDEIHNFCGRKTPRAIKKKWQDWLGEIRHRGATIEFLSQNPAKIATEIENEAGIRLQLVNEATRRDPIMGILIGDWYEMKAGLLGLGYTRAAWVLEKRQVDKKWVTQDKQRVTLDGEYFRFYDSFSTPQKGGKAGRLQALPHERMNAFKLCLWFIRRNTARLAVRGAIVAFVIWFAFLGGGGKIVNGFVSRMVGYATGEVETTSTQKEQTKPADSSTPEPLPIVQPDTTTIEDPRVKQLVESVIEAQTAELTRLQEKLETTEKQNKQLQEDLNRVDGVACLLPDKVVWGTGHVVGVGELIEVGHHEGKRIERIDWSKRVVVLDDGQTVGLLRRSRSLGLLGGSPSN